MKACANGLSEMVANLSVSVVSILYNYQLLKYYGEDGVATFGVLMYLRLSICRNICSNNISYYM